MRQKTRLSCQEKQKESSSLLAVDVALCKETESQDSSPLKGFYEFASPSEHSTEKIAIISSKEMLLSLFTQRNGSRVKCKQHYSFNQKQLINISPSNKM